MQRLIPVMKFGLGVFLLLAVTGCGNPYKDKVVGTWTTDMPFNPTITLNKDGTGNMKVGPISKELTWRLNGSNLIFKIDGKESGGLIKSADEKKIVLNDPEAKADFTFTRAGS